MKRVMVAALVILAGCASRGDDDNGGVATGGLSAMVGDWSATLQSQNASGVTGKASVHTAVGLTTAGVEISNATPNSHLPWHVHRGECGSNGPIHGSADAYAPLHVGTDGTAEGRASLNVALYDEQKYHVNVHRSATDLTPIACGNLKN